MDTPPPSPNPARDLPDEKELTESVVQLVSVVASYRSILRGIDVPPTPEQWVRLRWLAEQFKPRAKKRIATLIEIVNELAELTFVRDLHRQARLVDAFAAEFAQLPKDPIKDRDARATWLRRIMVAVSAVGLSETERRRAAEVVDDVLRHGVATPDRADMEAGAERRPWHDLAAGPMWTAWYTAAYTLDEDVAGDEHDDEDEDEDERHRKMGSRMRREHGLAKSAPKDVTNGFFARRPAATDIRDFGLLIVARVFERYGRANAIYDAVVTWVANNLRDQYLVTTSPEIRASLQSTASRLASLLVEAVEPPETSTDREAAAPRVSDR